MVKPVRTVHYCELQVQNNLAENNLMRKLGSYFFEYCVSVSKNSFEMK